jgi:hypothetical protein
MFGLTVMKGGEEECSFLLPCPFSFYLSHFIFLTCVFILLLVTRACSCRQMRVHVIPNILRTLDGGKGGDDGFFFFFFYECNMSGYTASFISSLVFPPTMGDFCFFFFNPPYLVLRTVIRGAS